MQRSIAERIARIPPVRVEGTFLRHAAPDRDAFAGAEGGRWGESFPVIYLGRPEDAVTVEAHRHLVEEPGIRPDLVKPRRLYTVSVTVHAVLDITVVTDAVAVGLTPDDLRSAVGDYVACQEVAQAAHQLELHGILAPSATGIGQTLRCSATGSPSRRCLSSEQRRCGRRFLPTRGCSGQSSLGRGVLAPTPDRDSSRASRRAGQATRCAPSTEGHGGEHLSSERHGRTSGAAASRARVVTWTSG